MDEEIGIFNIDSRYWHYFEINKPILEMAMPVLQTI